MPMIPEEISSRFGNHQLCWMATADADGVPNVAPMRQVWWIDERSLVIGDMFMKTTAANIQATGRMCLAAYDPENERAWKMTGKADYVVEGPHYDLAKPAWRNEAPASVSKAPSSFTSRPSSTKPPVPTPAT